MLLNIKTGVMLIIIMRYRGPGSPGSDNLSVEQLQGKKADRRNQIWEGKRTNRRKDYREEGTFFYEAAF